MILPRVQLVSFPRSGSTIFTNILATTFSLPFTGFGEVTNNSKETFARSHNLTLKINDKVKYIVLYRHPVQSITSFYWKTHKTFKKDQWNDFTIDWANRYNAFIKFWLIRTTKLSNIFYIYYDEFIRNTSTLFDSLSNFLLGTPIHWVGTEQIESRRRLGYHLENSKLTETMLDELEKRCSGRLEELGLGSWRISE